MVLLLRGKRVGELHQGYAKWFDVMSFYSI